MTFNRDTGVLLPREELPPTADPKRYWFSYVANANVGQVERSKPM